MDNLLLIKTPEEKLLKNIFANIEDDLTESICYIISSTYMSSDGGGGTDILGVFLSKEKAAKAFLNCAKQEFVGKNKEYEAEGMVYFQEEPKLEYWNDEYSFRCKNDLYDDYIWNLTKKKIGEMKT